MTQREFFDTAQAERYLAHSVVRKNGRPIYIAHVQNGVTPDEHRVSYYYVAAGQGDKDLSNPGVSYLKQDETIDFTPIPLGMCQYRARNRKRLKTFYIVRQPVRMWKIGLAKRNMRVHNIRNDVGYLNPPVDLIIWSQYFEDMVKGIYPGYDDAYFLNLKDPGNEIPISRRFAMHNSKLYYKAYGTVVGECLKNKLVLNRKYEYLDAVLKEDLGDAYN